MSKETETRTTEPIQVVSGSCEYTATTIFYAYNPRGEILGINCPEYRQPETLKKFYCFAGRNRSRDCIQPGRKMIYFKNPQNEKQKS